MRFSSNLFQNNELSFDVINVMTYSDLIAYCTIVHLIEYEEDVDRIETQ